MRRIIQCCLFLCIVQGLGAQATIYVKAGAGGANDGTSWANAYASLEAALLAAQPGDQLWVATGTYKSAAAYPNNTFEVQSGVELYGGFAGNETTLGQRNVDANLTILSGDALGDDIPGNFATNRADNAIHVLHTSNGEPANRAVIDGFTVSGGNTKTAEADPAATKRGAGFFIECKATIKNCTFTDNKADSGTGIMAPVAAASGLIVDNCTFINNEAITRAAGIYFLDMDGVQIRNCTFKDNKTNRGTLYPRTSKNIVIDNCLFENNNNPGAGSYCAGVFDFLAEYTISNCTFLNNTAGNATCLYHDTAKNTFIKNCTFNGNKTLDYGGTCVMSFQSTFNVDSCSFVGNSAPSSGAAFYNGDTCVFTVSNSFFEANTGNYASTVANYGIGCNGSFVNCTFKNNVATNGGGACSNGFKADVLFKGCSFESNTAAFGGALFTQNDTTRLRVEDCLFKDNGAETNGGCIYQNVNVYTSIKNSTFEANSADTGGALYLLGDSSAVVENCIFKENLCITQGAVANIGNGKVNISNSLFARNLNISAGNAGGSIINNASDGLTSTLKMVNCTVVDNSAPIGAGLAQWEDDTSSAVLILQNCILQNESGFNYEIEAGTPEVTSLGGNQSSDASLSTYLTGSKDVHDTVNSFVNPDELDYHLAAGVPAVDGGVAAGAPTTDLEGTLRSGDPDSGCYEWGTSGVFQPDYAVLPLQIAPNPTIESAMITLNSDWSGKAQLEVVAANGVVVRSVRVDKSTGDWQYRLNMTDLPSGNYRIQLMGAGKVFGSALVKM